MPRKTSAVVSVMSFRMAGPLAGGVAVVIFVDAAAEIAGGDERLGIVGKQFVAGELLQHEAVVGLVGVEGVDDVVAITPGVGAVVVGLVAVAVGVADEVQPVARPAFAVVRAGEEVFTRRSQASGAVSSMKARVCSGVGGMPMRSR